MKRVPFVNIRYSKGVPFLLKMVSFTKGLEVKPHGGAFLYEHRPPDVHVNTQ